MQNRICFDDLMSYFLVEVQCCNNAVNTIFAGVFYDNRKLDDEIKVVLEICE